MKKLLIFTDTDHTQINGVQVSLDNLVRCLQDSMEVRIVSPEDFTSFPMPSYQEILVSIVFPRQVKKVINEFVPDYIHIVTEWPIGIIAAKVCKDISIPYTSAFHTKFPEYVHLRHPIIPEKTVHKYLRYIHDGAENILVSSDSLYEYLQENGYHRLKIIRFGIDRSVFYPGVWSRFSELKRPILLFVGRIAIEKNIEAFLSIESPGTKIVVGDWPLRESLEIKYPSTIFLGKKDKVELGEIYRSSDVFVFPSKTDTLGLVNLEAMACGIPVVAFDVDGPNKIVEDGYSWILVPEDEPLDGGIAPALKLNKAHCHESVSGYSWESYAKDFMNEQILIHTPSRKNFT